MSSSTPDLPVDFSSFILSLAQSALVNLGESDHPDSGRLETNLPMARHSIDVLGMIKDKTQGNLDDEEQRLIDTLLYELRMKFVSKTKAS